MAANKTVSPAEEKMKGTSKTTFLKQNDSNEKNLGIDLLPIAFLRCREHCLCGAAVGHEYVLNAFAGQP